MRRISGFITVIGVSIAGTAFSHSIPTHLNLTDASVEFLAKSKAITCGDREKSDLKAILKIGTRHEDDYLDAQHPAKLGRFNFHFLPKLSGPVAASCSSFQWSGLASPAKTSIQCSYTIAPKAVKVIQLLAKNAVPAVGTFRMTNTHTYGAAVADARKPQTGKPAFGHGFEHLGYVLHLLQDLTSPAHSRGDPHGYIGHGAYPIQPQAVGSPDPMEVKPAGGEFERRPAVPTRGLIDKPPRQLFQELHTYVQRNFFSADTVFEKPGPADLSTKKGRLAAGCVLPGKTCKDRRGRSIAFHDPRKAGPAYKPHLAIWSPGGAGAGKDLPVGSLTVSYAVADAQWKELGPLGVLYGASLIDRYIRRETPLMPAECRKR